MKTKKYSKKRVYKKRTAKPKVVSKAVKKYVKSAIHKEIENKQYIQYASNQSIVGPHYILQLVPLVGLGSGSGNRIGNKITLMSSSINFTVNLLPYNATTNPAPTPIMFRWILLSHKSNNSSVFPTTNLFEITNSTINPQGNHLDLLFKINPEIYTVHKQGQFRLGSSSNSNQQPLANVAYEAGRMSIQKRLYFNKYLHKKICYDDTVVTPSNTNCWLIIFPVHANGSTNVAYTNSNISYVMTHQYEDA